MPATLGVFAAVLLLVASVLALVGTSKQALNDRDRLARDAHVRVAQYATAWRPRVLCGRQRRANLARIMEWVRLDDVMAYSRLVDALRALQAWALLAGASALAVVGSGVGLVAAVWQGVAP